ncbi:MAG TPA: GGDEF domain-containing protein [Gemmatimonadaceae bacterium]|nr:GGDEF domain-containing protein [Gemmatimonadaceae bacterium]
MISFDSSARLRAALIDHGSDGVADELRVLLRDVRSVELVPASAPDESRGEGATATRSLWNAPDVVVIALGAAVELGISMMAARRAVPDAAIVVVVPWFEEALFLSAIRLGAEDCVTAAQLDSPGLLRVLLVAAERHRLTSSLRAAAFTDELTGLYNRRGYVTRAATLLKVAEPRSIWQIFFDVDELKIINDTYGHWAGDRALMEVAVVLRQAFRSTDIVARVGGDEFAVLATAPADAAPDSWTARWREPFVALATRKDLPLSVSVGLAQPDEHGQMTPEDLLTRADTTMYTAKRLRKKLIDGRGLRPPGPLAVGATR